MQPYVPNPFIKMELAKPRIGLYQPYPHTFGGVQSMVIKLARALPHFGYEPVIISPEEGTFTEVIHAQNLACVVSDPGREWHVYGRGSRSLSYLMSFKRVYGLVCYWLKLSRDLRKNQIALLHCNDYRGVMLAAPAARLAGIPVIWHMHGFIPSRVTNFAAAALAHWTVPVSQGMLDDLKLPKWLLGQMKVIHNGLEPDPAPAPIQSGAGDVPVVLAVGTLHPRKGYETLIRGFKDVVARIPDAECWIVGGEFADGSYGRELRDLTQNLALGGHVKFLGHSSEVSRLMHRCALLAVPSRVEPFGMVAIEAMRAGKPVVACRTGGLPEIIAHRQTGVLVAPNDAAQMALAVVEILDDKNLADKMGRAGQRRVAEEFSLEKMTVAFAALYGRLLAGRTKPCAGVATIVSKLRSPEPALSPSERS